MSFLSNPTKAAESSVAQPAVPGSAQQADVPGSAQQPASRPLSEMNVRKSGKRVLKVTRSEAIADIETMPSSPPSIVYTKGDRVLYNPPLFWYDNPKFKHEHEMGLYRACFGVIDSVHAQADGVLLYRIC